MLPQVRFIQARGPARRLTLAALCHRSGDAAMITGVIGITLWTGDLDTMFHFYNDVMGLPLHARHDDFIAFEFGGFREFRFNLGLHGDVQGMSQRPVPDYGQLRCGRHSRVLPADDRGRRGVYSPAGAGTLGWLGSHVQGPRRQCPSAPATPVTPASEHPTQST